MFREIDRRAARLASQLTTHLTERLRTPWPHLEVGPHTYGSVRVISYEGDPLVAVRIGSYCSIAKGVEVIVGGGHRTDWASTYPFRAANDLEGALEDGHPSSRGDVTIGNDVWIARKATILSGVTIGDGAVIATNAVVTRDVRPYAHVAGVPAQETGRRFSDRQIEELLRMAWWTWPHDELLSVVHLLNGADVDELIAYGRSRRTEAPNTGLRGGSSATHG